MPYTALWKTVKGTALCCGGGLRDHLNSWRAVHVTVTMGQKKCKSVVETVVWN